MQRPMEMPPSQFVQDLSGTIIMKGHEISSCEVQKLFRKTYRIDEVDLQVRNDETCACYS